ncbi:MAG: NFACT RNA binding domain-containing protein [bacterium]
MTSTLPWRQRDTLAGYLFSWRQRFAGLAIARVTAGPGWVGLTLDGEGPAFLYLLARPGANLLWDMPELPPRAVRKALGWTKRPPLAAHLTGWRFQSAGLLPDDQVVALAFKSPAGEPPRYLLLQLFGPRGNVVLLDAGGKCLWSLFRSLHSVLTSVPPPMVFAPTRDDTAAAINVDDTFRQQAVAFLFDFLQVEIQTRLSRALRQAAESVSRLQKNLRADLDQASRGDEFRVKAETLATHLHEIKRGASTVELLEPVSGETITIGLDPASTPAANLERYFRKARKAARGRDIIAERLAAATERLEVLEAKRAELEQLSSQTSPAGETSPSPLDSLTALQEWQQETDIIFQEPGLTRDGHRRRPATGEPGRPFRRFLLDEKWEVWIGRSNQENDLLTHRSAAPHDIWLHAQGVAGSHVILRTSGKPDQVPRKVLAKAAALAALYSKARHTDLAPVLYTLRKYVRKPRKSPPGTAACIQEKSLMVAPETPPGAKKI